MARPKKRKTSRMTRPGGGRTGPSRDWMDQLQRVQEEMARIQEELAQEVVEVTMGGGAVRVLMTGHLILKEIYLDPELLDPENVDMLQDMIAAAVNKAIKEAQQLVDERMSALTGGLPLPGML